MTMCEQLSERMPAVARHEAEWGAEEEEHLASCAECRLEWKLVVIAGRLGADAAADLDPDNVSERVLGRVRSERRTRDRRIRWALAGVAAAAVLTVAVWMGRLPQRMSPPRGTAPITEVAQLPLPELDSLGTPELEAVLESLNAPIGTSVEEVDTTELDGLDARELQRVLDALEG